MGSHLLRADEVPLSDQEFMKELNAIKNPFEDGFPKPVISRQVFHRVYVRQEKPKAKPLPPPVIVLPAFDLQGVIVGEGIYQAIINDKIVPLGDSIEGARVDAVQKEGVTLSYKGKKFFLKVD